jgi:hypothetical protein
MDGPICTGLVLSVTQVHHNGHQHYAEHGLQVIDISKT